LSQGLQIRSICDKIRAKIALDFHSHPNSMKFPATIATLSVAVLSIALLAPLSITSATALSETTSTKTSSISGNSATAYKTKKGQLVITNLKPKQSFEVKYKNQKGRLGSRKVNTNGCGEALLSGAGKYQSVSIDNQEIQPSNLPTKEHPRCKPAKQSSGTK
jgi:hypothetical protein